MISLERAEQESLIESVFLAKDELDKVCDELKPILNPDPGCHLYGVMYSLLSELIRATEYLIEDNGNWLQWAVWDNDCCRNGYEAGISGSLKPIQSSSDLLDLIAEHNADV